MRQVEVDEVLFRDGDRDTALASAALLSFVETALPVGRRPELAPRVLDTFALLHVEGERAVAENLVALGWQIRAGPAEDARGF